MKKDEEKNKQPVDFIKEVKPESKLNKFLGVCKKHKAITISSSISIIVIILIIIAVIIVSLPKKTEEVSNGDNIIENTTAEATSEEQEQDITLQTDTNGLADGTEVAIIKNDDGTIEVIAKDDPKFAEKTEGKNYSTGTIENGGVKVKTNDKDLITIASKTQEEQKNDVKVENNKTPDTTVAEQQPETPAQPTDNNQGSSSNVSTSKPSGSSSASSKPAGNSGSSSSGATSSKSSGSSSSNSGSSSKPSGGSSSSSGSTSSKPSGGNSSGSSSTSKPSHTPFSTYSKYNASKTSQAVAWVKDEINKVGDSQYATVVASSSRPSGRAYSTFNETNARRKVSGGAVGTVYVYVEDTYMYDSSGTTANIFDTPMYIWIVN